MPNMGLSRLLGLNLVYKIRELMEDYGFDTSDGDYRVMLGYPNFIDSTARAVWPTVAVNVDNLYGRDVEIGSQQWPSFSISIDVFARTDSQKEDVSYMLWKNLNENTYNFYDFNSAFPSATGDYTGIYPYNYTADYYIENLTVVSLDPEDSTIVGEKHHSLIDGFVFLPNLN